jgi:hypothetical protein
MADRRVERRNFQVGTGMLNDPERLEELESMKQQRELNARLPPKVTFQQVLTARPVKPKPKPKRPVSKEKLRPTAAHPAQAMVGFGTDDDELNESVQKIVVKV